jgi:hypothetical protein
MYDAFVGHQVVCARENCVRVTTRVALVLQSDFGSPGAVVASSMRQVAAK